MSVIIILPKPGLQMAILKEVRGQMMEIISKQDVKVNERIAKLSAENLNLKVRADMIISSALHSAIHVWYLNLVHTCIAGDDTGGGSEPDDRDCIQ